MLPILSALYVCQAVYTSSTIRFSLVRLPFDIMSNMLLESVNMCTDIDCLKTSSNCLRIACESSSRSAKAIISADTTECATRSSLYDL